MALTAYISATQLLVHDTAGQRYTTTQLTYYINSARSQLALEAECVRFLYGLDGMFTGTGTFTSGNTVITGIASTVGLQVGWGLWGRTGSRGGFLRYLAGHAQEQKGNGKTRANGHENSSMAIGSRGRNSTVNDMVHRCAAPG